ncbi:hypothetical protein V9T40_008834 [Parthenolecanium corni]|uniref:Uncharacterized protein n=1 Tax=Parthenolecanium corni TaxID=536013 RepID=A0AAN9TNU7_9HEMI
MLIEQQNQQPVELIQLCPVSPKENFNPEDEAALVTVPHKDQVSLKSITPEIEATVEAVLYQEPLIPTTSHFNEDQYASPTKKTDEDTRISDIPEWHLGHELQAPSPFKNSLFWPNVNSKKTGKNKERVLPSTATSEEWLTFFKKKRTGKIGQTA